MSRTLTSWKEIAQYLGKGTRTVQRWEQEIGLPILRPHAQQRGVVLAHSDEIDAWIRSHFDGGSRSELDALRQVIVALRKENKLLRAKLERAERIANSADVES